MPDNIEWKPKHNPWLITLAVMMATFISALNSSVANVALKQIAGSFSISSDESLWILTSFLVASSILLPASAWFCSLMGRKKFFLLCLAMFTISSFVCGISPNFSIMILGRIVQGLGGGPLFPLSQAILLESFPKSEQGKAMAVFGIGVVLAPVLGPIVGGWLTTNFSWSWVFFISIPFGILAFVLVNLFIEDPPYMCAQKEHSKIDIIGFILLIIWLASFQTMLNDGQKNGWFDSAKICQLGITALVSFCALIWWELTNKEPLFDLKIFKNWNFTIGTIIYTVIFAIFYASMAILPQFLQTLMGYDSFLSGLAAGPMGVGSLSGIILAGVLAKIVDLRKQVFTGCICMTVACFMFSQLNLNIALSDVIIPNVLFGFGLTLLVVPIITLIFAYVSNEETTNASGLQNLLKNVGSAVGSSMVGITVSTYMQIHQTYLVGKLNIYNPVFQQKLSLLTSAFLKNYDETTAAAKANIMLYKQLSQQAMLSAYMSSYKLYALAIMLSIPFIFILKRVKYSK